MDTTSDLDHLVADWTLVGDELSLVARRRGATRLRFALWLKFFGRHGRFPAAPEVLDSDAIGFVAQQVGVDPARAEADVWLERTARFRHAQIRGQCPVGW